jgi:hypothetical protein
MATVRMEIVDPTLAQFGPSTTIEIRRPTLAQALTVAVAAALTQTHLDLEGLLRAVQALRRSQTPPVHATAAVSPR